MFTQEPATRRKSEPTIALINIVFLMLIFFLIAGTLAPPIEQDLALVKTQDLENKKLENTLVVHADGRLAYLGKAIDAPTYVNQLEGDKTVRLMPDKDLPALALIELAENLRVSGASRIILVSEKDL